MLDFHFDQILFQMILFLGLWYFLDQTIFARLATTLAARDTATAGAIQEAAALREKTQALRVEHDAALAELRRQASTERDALRHKAESEEQVIIEAARVEAAAALTATRERVAGEIAAARSELSGHAEKLAEAVATEILSK